MDVQLNSHTIILWSEYQRVPSRINLHHQTTEAKSCHAIREFDGQRSVLLHVVERAGKRYSISTVTVQN